MILFDFDGVLIDSLDEVAITSYNAALEENLTELKQLPGNYLQLFRANRHHVQPAGDFLVFAFWCFEQSEGEHNNLLALNEFNQLLLKETRTTGERTELFFKARARFIENELEKWLALHNTMRPISDHLEEFGQSLILTNKNRHATEQLCHFFGLPFSSENIYTGDKGSTKIENFRRIQQRFPGEQFVFIDDSIKNLVEISKAFPDRKLLRVLHASWGYLGPADAEHAKSLGISSINQTDFIKNYLAKLP